MPQHSPCEPACLRGLATLLDRARDIQTVAFSILCCLSIYLLTVLCLKLKDIPAAFLCELTHVSLIFWAYSFIQISEFRSGPEGATVFDCNLHSEFLVNDISISNPEIQQRSCGQFSPLPLFCVEFIACLSPSGVLRLILRLVQLRVTSASLAPVGGGLASPACLLWRAGAGPSAMGEDLRWPAGGSLWVPAGKRQRHQKIIRGSFFNWSTIGPMKELIINWW